ncbi:MAG: tRNA pseudouridine(55) synthase TruB [Christensenellaceae bacterium]|nr:tRNA pseudouridine(55) synthase TruB [Christensenellaceae bacterium]
MECGKQKNGIGIGGGISGVLNVCKPVGLSSFRVVSLLRRRFGIKKVGHLGTLDPLACGVLVLLCGAATKRMNELSGGTKVYRSIFTFGVETATLDKEGEVIKTDNKKITETDIKNILSDMTGEIEITVPKFSAVHIGGRRAYDLARSGIDFTPPKKTVSITRFELLKQMNENEFFFEIECTTGTYIRSLAKLLAEKLDTVAIASLIIRTRVGDFDISGSHNLDEVSPENIMLDCHKLKKGNTEMRAKSSPN